MLARRRHNKDFVLQKATWAALVAAMALLVVGCGKSASHGTLEASASPAASAMATVTPAVGTSEAPSTSPQATPTSTATAQPTPDPNLLAWSNGTIVRSYPTGSGDNANDFAHSGFSPPSGNTQPYSLLFELPGTAAFTSFATQLPDAGPSAVGSVVFAVSSDGPTGMFHDVGSITQNATSELKTLSAGASGRWVRVTSSGIPIGEIDAYGTLAPPPKSLSVAGIYVEDRSPYKDGAFLGHTRDSDPWYRRFVAFGNVMTASRCYNGGYGSANPGTLDGRTWTFQQGTASVQAIINDDASLIVANDGSPLYLMRSSERPKYCEPFSIGSGAHHVLVLENTSTNLWPMTQNAIPGYAYKRIGAGMLRPEDLVGKELVILNTLCNGDSFFAKGQSDALLQWVHAGHKLLIVDSDVCSKSSYNFLPYPFITSNPGARGAPGSRLILVENDALGTADKSDAAHYFDPKAYVTNGGEAVGQNQLGDANVVLTHDPHWCGHLFGTNVTQDNGFMQMYAVYGQGLIIYDGFDDDDGSNVGYQRVRSLEFVLPVPASLPCTQSAASGFIVQPNQETSFAARTSQRLKFSMELLANLGWKGHIAMKASGDFPATISPTAFDIAGGTQALQITVVIPASAKAGVYTVDVIGDDGVGHTAQAAINFTALAPLKKTIKKRDRIRIYGLHFDVDSAHIQPKSETVVRQIADLMKANPTMRFQVEGHTDSDGGAAYNLRLSQRRAQAVVDDLVHRYGIARTRLIPKGFGLTEPVKPNTTAANKALNRRVELLAM